MKEQLFKRKTMKKLLSLLLVLAMVFSMLPVSALPAFADEDTVAKIGETEYTSLIQAMTKATDGQTVTLLKDITLTTDDYMGTLKNNQITFYLEKNVTVDLGGNTLQLPDSWIAVWTKDEYKFTVKDSSSERSGKFLFGNHTYKLVYGKGYSGGAGFVVAGGVFNYNIYNIAGSLAEGLGIKKLSDGLYQAVLEAEADKVAEIVDGQQFTTLAAAVRAASENDSAEKTVNDEIVLLKDTTEAIAETAQYATYTINLNGKKWSSEADYVYLVDAHTNNVNITIKNGEITGDYYGVVTNGTNKNNNLTLDNLKVTGRNGFPAMYAPAEGSLTIQNGCELIGAEGLAVKGSDVTIGISGSKLTANGTYAVPTAPSNDGFYDTGAGLYVEDNYFDGTTHQNPTTIVLENADITSVNGHAIEMKFAGSGNRPDKHSSISIKGGKYKSAEDKDIISTDNTTKGYVTITGGEFSAVPDASYLAEGKQIVNNTGSDAEKYPWVVSAIEAWSYSVDGATLTASCNGECGTAGAHKATLTLYADSKAYTGNEIENAASFDDDELAAWTAAKLIVPSEISYSYKGENGEYSAVGEDGVKAIGYYKATATVTVDGKSLKIEKVFTVDGVLNIGNSEKATTATTFSGNKDTLTTVSFKQDSSVETIGKDTFKDCEKLEKVTLPEKVNTIEAGAFALSEEKKADEQELTVKASVAESTETQDNSLTINPKAFENRTKVTLQIFSKANLWTLEGGKMSSDSFKVGDKKAMLTEKSEAGPTALSEETKIAQYNDADYTRNGAYTLSVDDKDYTVELFFLNNSGEVNVIESDPSSGTGALLLIGGAAAAAVAVYKAPVLQAKAEKYGVGQKAAAKLVKAHDFVFGVDSDEKTSAEVVAVPAE